MTDQHRHDALLYEHDDDLQAGVLATLAREAGPDDLVVLACRRRHRELLAHAVGSVLPGVSPAVVLLSRPAVHTRPVAVLAAQRRLRRHPSRRPNGRIWYVAEPDHGSGPDEWVRAGRYEAACAFALDHLPLTTICAYPRAATPDAVLADVRRTHSRLITADGPADNPAADDPLLVLAQLSPTTAMPDPPGPPALRVTGSAHLHEIGRIRARISDVLGTVPTLIRTDFVAAVNEALTNAHLHGVPPVDVSVWVGAGVVECRITDRGAGFADPAAGYLPQGGPSRSRTGLWLARQACDDIDTWRTADGFTIRLATSTAPEHALETHGARARAETAKARATLARRRLTHHADS